MVTVWEVQYFVILIPPAVDSPFYAMLALGSSAVEKIEDILEIMYHVPATLCCPFPQE
jgi:hypothetical protein